MPRRKKQYSVITRKGSPFWQYRLEGWTGYKSTPIPVKMRSGEPRNKAEAEEWAAEEWKKNGGIDPKAHGKTLREFLVPYFVPGFCPHIARILADSGRYSAQWAREQRGRIDRYILTDRIADIEIGDLRPGHFEDLKLRLRLNPISSRTVNIIMGALKTAITEGYHRGDIEGNPTAGVGKIRETPEETGIFSPDEVLRIITEPGLFNPHRKHYGIRLGRQPQNLAYTFSAVLALTGERPEAILSLRWGDITGDIVSFARTKTTTGRQIPVAAFITRALEDLRDAGIRTEADDWIFGYEDGSRCTRTWYRKRFLAMMKRAKFPQQDPEGRKRIPYSLKHSLITHLVDAGADEVLVREYVGHSHGYGSTRILTRVQATYKHRQTERLREILPWIGRMYGV